jgi:hypothetical protein
MARPALYRYRPKCAGSFRLNGGGLRFFKHWVFNPVGAPLEINSAQGLWRSRTYSREPCREVTLDEYWKPTSRPRARGEPGRGVQLA